MDKKSDKFKLTGWILLIVLVVGAGVSLDFLGNNFPVEYKKIDIATGPNKTVSETVVVIPAKIQIIRLSSNFLYGLAVALFATIFVARKLEESQKDKNKKELEVLSEKVNINVFDALFKTIIPPEIFQVVKDEIIESKVLRKKAFWSFEFKEVDDDIKMCVTTNYELHNICNEVVDNPVQINLEPMSSDEQIIEDAQCISSNGESLIKYDSNDYLNHKNIDIKEEENGKKTINYTVKIPSKDYIKSTFKFSTVFKENVYDSQHTRYPIIDLNISAVFPEGYKFELYPLLSQELTTISEGETHKNMQALGGILARQGIIYKLEKIKG